MRTNFAPSCTSKYKFCSRIDLASPFLLASQSVVDHSFINNPHPIQSLSWIISPITNVHRISSSSHLFLGRPLFLPPIGCKVNTLFWILSWFSHSMQNCESKSQFTQWLFTLGEKKSWSHDVLKITAYFPARKPKPETQTLSYSYECCCCCSSP